MASVVPIPLDRTESTPQCYRKAPRATGRPSWMDDVIRTEWYELGGSALSDRAIAVYTPTTVERILEDGGIGPLRLNPVRAHENSFVVCIRNAQDRWAWAANERGPEEHRSTFLVGRITGLESSIFGGEDRYVIRI